MKKIKILGAGISSLTAAINLSMAGFDVEVFEKNSDCGARFNEDLQGLENWSEKIDVLDSFVAMNIKTNFEATPFNTVSFSNCKTTKDFSFDRPLFYLVKRGTNKDSLDCSLKEQAIASGVKINFNQSISECEADIVGTGPRIKQISIVDKGITFQTDLPDMAICLVNNQAAYKGYSYLLIVNGYACMCSCVFNDPKKLNDCFDYTQKYFVEKYSLNIVKPKSVGGVGYFTTNNTYQVDKTLFVGEVAGLQDFLAGFGMRTAIVSGYLAAKSIIENADYSKLASAKFKRHLHAGIVNRYAWEHINGDNFITVLEKLNKMNHKTDLLRSVYNFNPIQHLGYPRAIKYIKKHYPKIGT